MRIRVDPGGRLGELGEILRPERLTGMPADDSVNNTATSAEAVPRDEVTTELPIIPNLEG